MRVVVSIDSMLDSLLAASAMAAIGTPSGHTTLFTPDHRPALRMACRDVLRRTALQLAPYLESVSLDGDNPEFRFHAALCPDSAAMSEFVASAVVAGVLHLMLVASHPSLAAAHAQAAAEALAGIHRCVLRAARARSCKIRPHG